MDDWLDRHVSDHAGIPHRQLILARGCGLPHLALQHDASTRTGALNCVTAQAQLFADPGRCLRDELQRICELIERYPGHEALWLHRRFVWQALAWRAEPELMSLLAQDTRLVLKYVATAAERAVQSAPVAADSVATTAAAAETGGVTREKDSNRAKVEDPAHADVRFAAVALCWAQRFLPVRALRVH